MKIPTLLYRAAIVSLAAVPFTLPEATLADTYQIYALGTANDSILYGIDTSGAVVVEDLGGGPHGDPLYQTYVAGDSTSSSLAPPVLSYDDGSACTPTVSPGITWGAGFGQTRCNNGHEIYAGIYSLVGNPNRQGIFTGPNLSDLLTSSVPGVNDSSLDSVVMNSSGDFAWVDGRGETIYQAVDLTSAVPEPGTLLYLGTGVLTLACSLRRRLFS